MEFYINFSNWMSEFNETIESPPLYEDFSLFLTLSEGEKLRVRIDLALLFTWREVATIQELSVNTNLLITGWGLSTQSVSIRVRYRRVLEDHSLSYYWTTKDYKMWMYSSSLIKSGMEDKFQEVIIVWESVKDSSRLKQTKWPFGLSSIRRT